MTEYVTFSNGPEPSIWDEWFVKWLDENWRIMDDDDLDDKIDRMKRDYSAKLSWY